MQADEHFVIRPFEGAGAINFGMSPSNVAALIGDPDQISTNHLKQRVEFRSFMNVAYATDSGKNLIVNHIGFGRQMQEVLFENANLFRDDPRDVLRALTLADRNPMIYLGFVVFLNLGVALTGFHDNDISQKAVSVFERGAWDKRLAKMAPFALGG